MKHIIILGDGMADWPVESLQNKTLLKVANTPYMDMLAAKGRCGRLVTVAPGFHPGSEVANMSVLGYNLPKVYEGRGVLEAASIGVNLQPGDMAMRCNIICIENNKIKNHSAGHITTEDADILVKYLQEKLGSDIIHFYTGIQYRHLLVIKGGSKYLDCTPPHDVPGQLFRPLLVKPMAGHPEAQPTADLINHLIFESQKLLADHPLNIKRIAEGKDPANSIWPWSPGYRPQMEIFSHIFPQVKSGSVISAVDLIKGIGIYAGLHNIEVEGATGLYNTNYEGKAQAAVEALRKDDFVFLHLEASDEAGHEGNIPLKIKTIEYLDSRIIGPVYEAVKDWTDPVAIAVLPDHPTPCEHRTHTAEPVPFLIYYPGIEPDSVKTFNEISCVEGSFGLLKGDEFINEFMKN